MLASTALGAQPYVIEALQWLPDEDGLQKAELRIERAILPEQPQLSGSDDHGERATILLADDNADMRDYVGHLLSAGIRFARSPLARRRWPHRPPTGPICCSATS